ncbi:MAG: HU family DNA-binding protein [Prevotellaceae bacterium]|nr:HU family DNA-binding protein [Candidatus Minthosoma equi]
MGLIVRKTKKTLGFQEGKPTVYKLQNVIFPQVTSDQLIEECSISCGVNPSQTKAVISALLDRLVHYMVIGHGVRLESFGSFSPKIRVKCVKTEEEATVETVQQKYIRFTPGKKFRTMLNDLTVETARN